MLTEHIMLFIFVQYIPDAYKIKRVVLFRPVFWWTFSISRHKVTIEVWLLTLPEKTNQSRRGYQCEVQKQRVRRGVGGGGCFTGNGRVRDPQPINHTLGVIKARTGGMRDWSSQHNKTAAEPRRLAKRPRRAPFPVQHTHTQHSKSRGSIYLTCCWMYRLQTGYIDLCKYNPVRSNSETNLWGTVVFRLSIWNESLRSEVP